MQWMPVAAQALCWILHVSHCEEPRVVWHGNHHTPQQRETGHHALESGEKETFKEKRIIAVCRSLNAHVCILQ